MGCPGTSGMWSTGTLPTDWWVLVYWTRICCPGGTMKMSPLQVCLEGSNLEADGGARFNCLSMVKKPKVRHPRKAGLRTPGWR